MSESMKKTAEMNELLTEVKDMELGDETGAGLTITINPNVTKALNCGRVLTISAECIPGHKPCNIIIK